MSETSKPVFLDSTKAVGLSVAIGGMIAIVSYQGLPIEAVAFTMLLLPFLPLPVAFLTARHGVATGAVAGLVVGSLCTTWTLVTGSSVSLLVFLFAAVAGVFAGAGFRAGTNIYRMLVMLMLLFLGMIAVWFGAYLLKSDVGPVAALTDFSDSVAEESSGLYEAIGAVQGSREQVVSELRQGALRSAPSLLIVAAGLMSIVTVSVSRFVFGALKQPFPADIRFSELRLHFGFVYMFIASLAFLMAAYWLEGTAKDWTEGIGQNLLLVTSALFFIQGLAIAAWFLARRKASGAVKAGVYFLLGLLEGFFSLVSFVGIFDVFMDFRKRYGGKNAGGKEVQ